MRWLAISILTCEVACAAPVKRPRTPPVSALRISGEAAAGIGTAVGGAAIGLIVGGGIGCRLDCEGHGNELSAGTVITILGGGLGALTGIGVGVWGVGQMGDETGSVGASIGGALIGGAVGGVVVVGIERSAHANVAALVVAGASPLLGAIVGFNLTRRWKDEELPAVGSLLRLDGGRWRAGLPIVTPEARGTYVSIVGGTF